MLNKKLSFLLDNTNKIDTFASPIRKSESFKKGSKKIKIKFWKIQKGLYLCSPKRKGFKISESGKRAREKKAESGYAEAGNGEREKAETLKEKAESGYAGGVKEAESEMPEARGNEKL